MTQAPKSTKPTNKNIEALVKRRELLLALREHYEPHPKQQQVLDAIKAGYKKIFVRAARQSGKTQEALDISWGYAGLNPKSVCSIITPFLKQAKRVYWKKRTLQDFGPRSWVKKEDNETTTLFFHNGSYIELDGSDNIESHRGDKKHLIILDEYKDIDPRFYPEVIEPMFVTLSDQAIVVIIGTPPEDPNSHYAELEAYAQKAKDWACIHWTAYESPYSDHKWLDDKREELEARGELDTFKREYLAEYTTGGKNSVFPMFSRSLHMRSPQVLKRYFKRIKDRCELYWVSDPATSSIFGSLFIAYHRDSGQILFLDEIYEGDKHQTHTEAIVNVAKAKMAVWDKNLKNWSVVYDDAEAWFGNELKHGHGIAAFPAGKAAVEKEEGIALFKSLLLQKNTVVISKACENLAKELESYIMINGKYPKIHDHLIDTTRYFLLFAHVVINLAEKSELLDDTEELFDYLLNQLYDETGLPEWTQ